jgi:hypothetical protein
VTAGAPAGTGLVSAARWVLLAVLAAATALSFRVPPPAPAPVEYLCPMHPEVTSRGPGRCPLCGMPLEPARRSGRGLRLTRHQLVLGAIQLTRPVPGPAGAWWIPIHAVLLRPSGARVYVAGPDGRSFSARPVQPVEVDGSRVAVLGEGLEERTQVVAAGAEQLDSAGTAP